MIGWRIERVPNYQGQPHLVGAHIVNDDVMIAEVRGAIEVGGHTCLGNLEPARLIAAAPALLFALKKMVEQFAPDVDSADWPDAYDRMAVISAREAIARAEPSEASRP